MPRFYALHLQEKLEKTISSPLDILIIKYKHKK